MRTKGGAGPEGGLRLTKTVCGAVLDPRCGWRGKRYHCLVGREDRDEYQGKSF